MNLSMCLSKTARRRERATTASRNGLDQRGVLSRPRRPRRVLAMVSAGVMLVLLITLSPAASMGGDHDDDDGHAQAAVCSPAATCCAAPVAACSPPAVCYVVAKTTLVSPGCPYENLGTIGAVTWYDVWKYCQPSGGCFGRLIEGWPHSNEDLDLCPDDMAQCANCLGGYTENAETKPQKEPVDWDVNFITKEHVAVVENSTFYATAEGLNFKILTIRTEFPGDVVRFRRIGVQIKELPPKLPEPKSAQWSAEQGEVGNSKHRHHIDVPFIRKGRQYLEQYRVTTAAEATHPTGE